MSFETSRVRNTDSENEFVISPIQFFAALVSLAFLFFGAVMIANAGKADIQFPVAALGGCASESECFSFCESPENFDACLTFASANDLLPKEEINQARAMIKAVDEGNTPGGCKTETECEAYCSSVSTLDECVAFGEKNDFMDKEHLGEAKKILKALESGVTLPGGCQSEIECEQYCSDGTHMEECVAFAKAAGFMSKEELKEMERVLPLMQQGLSPGGCTSRESCDAYCEDEAHVQECVAFAEKAGFVSKEEADMIRKTGGKGPGGCTGKAECDAFCETNHEACFEFGLKHGLIPEEDAERIRKTGGKSPGNCKGKEECEAFCEDPTNQETCFEFAKEHGLISEDELHLIENNRSGPGGCFTPEACHAFCSDPANQEECSKFGPGEDDGLGFYDDPNFIGPGGCTNIDECDSYCSDPEKEATECKPFYKEKRKEFDKDKDYFNKNKNDDFDHKKSDDKFDNDFKGPGGCSTPKECADFCSVPENGPICTPGSEFKDFPKKDDDWNDDKKDEWKDKPGDEFDPSLIKKDGEWDDHDGPPHTDGTQPVPYPDDYYPNVPDWKKHEDKPFPPGPPPVFKDGDKDKIPLDWPDDEKLHDNKWDPPKNDEPTKDWKKDNWEPKLDWEEKKPDQFKSEDKPPIDNKWDSTKPEIKSDGDWGKEGWDPKSDWKDSDDWKSDSTKKPFPEPQPPVIGEVKEFIESIPLDNFPSETKPYKLDPEPLPVEYQSPDSSTFTPPTHTQPDTSFTPPPTPDFTPPSGGSNDSGGSTFNPPSAPSFTPPSAPNFTPPSGGSSGSFVPPSGGSSGSFTPPASGGGHSGPPPSSSGDGGGGSTAPSNSTQSFVPRRTNAKFASFVTGLFGRAAKKVMVAFSL